MNDGSTDNSLDICEEFSRKDNRVKVINKKNEGCIATRQKGVNLSSSNYIMFVDADDWINETTVENLYYNLINSNSDISVCNMYKVIGSHALIKLKSENNYFKENRVYEDSEVRNELVVSYLHGHSFPSNLCGKLYKKELLQSCGNFLNRIHFFGEDLYYNLEILLKANRVKVIDKPLYYYRAGGTSSKYMSYLFKDSISGYQIQKEIIDEFFKESKQARLNGISIMLLNILKTCLINLFYSNLCELEILKEISRYVKNDSIRECLENKGVKKYLELDYLNAIVNEDIKYLYTFGLNGYKKQKPRKFIINILSRVC